MNRPLHKQRGSASLDRALKVARLVSGSVMDVPEIASALGVRSWTARGAIRRAAQLGLVEVARHPGDQQAIHSVVPYT